MLYGTITEFCTEDRCPIMSAGIDEILFVWQKAKRKSLISSISFSGPKYEYHWADGQTVKKPIKCSAPKYIDYLMTWVQDQLDDESLFPSKIGKIISSSFMILSDETFSTISQMYFLFISGVPFPKNFMMIAKTILKRLFRVYAHIYHQHFR